MNQEIFRSYDEWGPISVYEDGCYRYMCFGDGGEQACINFLAPEMPVFEYIQAMLLAACFHPQAKHATLLGLGAGNLVQSLLHIRPELDITTVELRPEVAEIARQWFAFEHKPNIDLQLMDAEAYLFNAAATDLLFIDLYTDEGMEPAQLDDDFLADCHKALNPGGVLAMNLWDDNRGEHPQASAALLRHFGQLPMLCQVPGGNLVAFVCKGKAPKLNNKSIIENARQASQQLNAPLHRLLSKVRCF